jgi:hypothetical protein
MNEQTEEITGNRDEQIRGNEPTPEPPTTSEETTDLDETTDVRDSDK